MSVPYPANPYPRAHPDRFQAIAEIHGMCPHPVTEARILDIGCGDGGQIIPMAQYLPDATLIGVDNDSAAISRAKSHSQKLGLTNIEWHCASIESFQTPPVDYVIAHGLYSWVPESIRPQIWQTIKHVLSINGIAFISHVCLPGGHLREMARAVMLSAAKAEMNEKQKVEAGLVALSNAVDLHGPQSVLGAAFNETLKELSTKEWGYVWHDFWVSGYAAFSLETLNRLAGKYGFRYLNDVELGVNMPLGLPAKIAFAVEALPDLVSKGQLIDTYLGRSFRRGLWVHQSQALNLTLDALDHMWVRARYERHETDEGVLLVTDSGKQLGFRGRLAYDLTAQMAAVPECCVADILGEHPNQTRQWLYSLIAAGALAPSVRSRSLDFPKREKIFGQQTLVNCFHEPTRISHFDAATLNAYLDGHRGLELVEQLVLSAKRGDFEARIDGKKPENETQWHQIVQGALPSRVEQLWRNGLISSPRIFAGV